VKSEPDWSLLPGETPSRVRDLLQRCFRKAPDKRLRDVGEARLAIEATEDGDEPSKAVPERTLLLWWGAAAIAILGALAGGLAVWVLKGEGPKPVVRLATVLPLDEDLARSRSRMAVSPDGRKLVYRLSSHGKPALATRSLDTLEPRIIEGSENGAGAFFSPDGDWIAFVDPQGKLKKVRIGGDAPLTIAELSVLLSGIYFWGTWGDDGTIVFTGGTGTLLRVSGAGGTPEEATALDRARGEILHSQPEVLPGGKALLYLALVAPSKRQDLVVRPKETGITKVLLEGATGPARYVPTGHLLFARESTLFAVPFDLRNLELWGDPFPVAEGLEVSLYGNYRAAQFDVSKEGTLVYLVDTPGIRASLVWVDRHGKATPVTEERNAYMVPRLSPDGDRIAFTVLDEETGQRDVWVLDRNRGTRTRLTFGEGLSTDPVWSPDGRTVAFASTRSGRFSVFSLAEDGTGEATPLTRPREGLIFPRQWLPDGSGLLFQVVAASQDIGVLRVGARFEEEILLGTPFWELEPSVSPDGKWLAYASDESGRREVYVRDFPGPGRRWLISADGGDEPLWAPSGLELFYRNDNQMMVVPISAAREPGTPLVLFEGEYERDPFGNDARNYDLSPDGTRFLMVRREVESDRPQQQQLNVVLNWFEELKRLDPNR
jgi:serine/threonine-protein kinase